MLSGKATDPLAMEKKLHSLQKDPSVSNQETKIPTGQIVHTLQGLNLSNVVKSLVILAIAAPVGFASYFGVLQ